MQSIPFKAIAIIAVAAAIPVIGAAVWLWLQWQALTVEYPFFTAWLRIAVMLLIVVMPAWYLGTGAIVLWRRWGWRESIAAHYAIHMKRAEVQVAPLAQHLHYEVTSEPNSNTVLQLPSPIDVVKPMAEWMAWVDEQPHCLLSGRTKAGKTHTATAILGRRMQAGETAYLIDPHSSGWMGLPTVGFVGMRPDGKPDTKALNAALMHVAGEYIRRMQARDEHKNATGQELPHNHWPRWTVLIDESNYIADTLPTVWREFIKALASGGRKVGISLICLAQSPLVEDLGLSGSMRSNFARLALDDRSIQQLIASDEKDTDRKKALQSALVGVERPAAATIDAQVWLLDRRGLEAGSVPSGNHLSKNPVPDSSTNGNESSIAVTRPGAEVPPSSIVPTNAEIAAIAARLGTGTPSQVAKTLDGYHPRKHAEFKAKVDYVQALLKGGAE